VTSQPADVVTGYESAVATAIQFYENQILDPIPVTLDITFSFEGIGGGGESGFGLNGVSYSDLYNALKAIDTNPNTSSAVQRAAFALLPSTDPTGGTGEYWVTNAQDAALGLAPGNAGNVGQVILASGLTWAWSQNDIGGSSYDAVGVFEHEISEVMGREDLLGQPDTGNNNAPQYEALDFYHYTALNNAATATPGSAAGTLDQPFVNGYDSSANAFFSYNGTSVTLPYDTPSQIASGADIADWNLNGDSYGYVTNGLTQVVSPTDLEEMSVIGYDVACYLRGTHILTDQGPVAVEDLTIGDMLITHAGEARPLRWIGRRRFDGIIAAAHPHLQPILIQAHAIADSVPERDLFVSPMHALYLDQILIPASALVNGTTILKAQNIAKIDYFHLELDTHDAVMAEGLAAETYLDEDNRGMFHNAAEYTRVSDSPALSYAPRIEQGPQLDAIRRCLAERAVSLGHNLPHPHEIVITESGTISATVPAGTDEIHLITPSGRVPHDRRLLGALLLDVKLNGQPIELSDPRLTRGFHAVERHGQNQVRWTNGNGVITIPPSSLPQIIEVVFADMIAGQIAA
jgi:hypothetical protein